MNIKYIVSINANTLIVMLETDESIITTKSSEIYWVEIIESDKFILYTKNEKYPVQSFKYEYEAFLKKAGLIQIHKKYAVNPEKIKTFKTLTMEVEIENQQMIPVNRKYKRNLLNYIKALKLN